MESIMSRQSGFTIVELMIVLAIVGILITVAIPSFRDQMERRRLIGAAELVYVGELELEEGRLDKTGNRGADRDKFKDAIDFVGWYTYDLERPDSNVTAMIGDPGHRWMTAQGSYPWLDPEIKRSVYGTAVLELWQTEGGVFDQGQPEPSWEPDGTLTLEFDTCSTATATYDIPSANVSGTIPLERIALDNVRRCYELDRNRWGTPSEPN